MRFAKWLLVILLSESMVRGEGEEAAAEEPAAEEPAAEPAASTQSTTEIVSTAAIAGAKMMSESLFADCVDEGKCSNFCPSTKICPAVGKISMSCGEYGPSTAKVRECIMTTLCFRTMPGEEGSPAIACDNAVSLAASTISIALSLAYAM